MSQGFAQGLPIPVPVIQGGTGLSSTTINQILYSSANNVIAGLPTVNSSLLTTSVGGVPIWSALTGFANAPVNTNITSMTGITGTIQAPTGITSSSGNNFLTFTYNAGVGNYLNINNTVLNPRITAVGVSASIGIALAPKNGTVSILDTTATVGGRLTFNNAASTQATSIQAADAQATSANFILPALDGSNGADLWTNGTGTWSFATHANTNITSMTGLTGVIQAPTFINSSAGLNLLGFSYIASAVNYISIQNNTTTQNPAISALGTDSNITLQLNGKGLGGIYLSGTRTNDNAVSFQVGEFISSIIPSASAVTLTNATPINVTSISLTAGDWDVWGNVSLVTIGTTHQSLNAWVSSTSATLTDSSLYGGIALTAAGGVLTIGTGAIAPQRRFSLAATTTIYLTAYSTATSGSGTGSGAIYARRAR